MKFARTLLVGLALALSTVSVSAGMLEDAKSAYDRRDYETAVPIYRKLAEQGSAEAQWNLGTMYANGVGVPHDEVEAVKWFRLSAEQGHVAGQFWLATSYEGGYGVPQNDVLAHMWSNVALSLGREHEYFIRRQALDFKVMLEERMTREQIAKAERLAQEWMAKH